MFPQEFSPLGLGAENKDDEFDILADQDDTLADLEHRSGTNLGAEGTDKLTVDEPTDFIRGEIDVKAQMDRASAAMLAHRKAGN